MVYGLTLARSLPRYVPF